MSDKEQNKRKGESAEAEQPSKEAKSEASSEQTKEEANKEAQSEAQAQLQATVTELKAVPERMRIAAQKIIPFFWFDDQTEEAMRLYTSVFENSMIDSVLRYPHGIEEGPMAGQGGKVLTGSFHLAGQQFMGLDGGPLFKFSPGISLFINCDTEQEVDQTWAKLSEGGTVFMELGEHALSKKFGWTSDKFGLSWQVCLGTRKQKINPFMLFVGDNHGKAEEAIKFYMSLFPNSEMQHVDRWGPGEEPEVEGTIRRAQFQLCGNEYVVMESKRDHHFSFNEAFSFLVDCKDQEEIDFFWDKLSADPESERCGWLKDKYGVSWQIHPAMLPHLNTSKRVMESLLSMKKIDIATLLKAFEEDPKKE